MGLPFNTLKFIVDNLGKPKSKKMLELGNQRIRGNVNTSCKTGKHFFEGMGYDHTSIDMNGKDGALQFDLCKPINGLGKFDVITNSGTSGYIKDQYECFANIEKACKIGGRMIHVVPEKGSNWAGEQYDELFFADISRMYNYRVIVNKTIEGQYGLLRAVVLVKKKNDKQDIPEQ